MKTKLEHFMMAAPAVLVCGLVAAMFWLIHTSEQDARRDNARKDHDQCLRQELFKECMAALPAGPVATKYNDWDEVVRACEGQALDASLRLIQFIKPECRTK